MRPCSRLSPQHKCAHAVRHKGEERTYVAEDIISMVLQHLVAIAEQHLMGRPVRHVRC